MIAIFYNSNASPYTMYVIENVSGEHHEFLEMLTDEYPFPENEVMFIENDKVVDMWDPHRD